MFVKKWISCDIHELSEVVQFLYWCIDVDIDISFILQLGRCPVAIWKNENKLQLQVPIKFN